MCDKKQPKFEECLKKLENIVTKLENNDLPLDQALKNFEEGIRLTRICNKMLDDAERRINILIDKEDGTSDELAFEAVKEE
ncbi:MAG: exodeoxyribonuclease VII small subunit [Clostridia bacterium]|nr:exodeoxyribonuclease VII small subunit [Clostridia bacterium]